MDKQSAEVTFLAFTRAELSTLIQGLSCAVSEATSDQDEQEFLTVRQRVESVLADWDRARGIR